MICPHPLSGRSFPSTERLWSALGNGKARIVVFVRHDLNTQRVLPQLLHSVSKLTNSPILTSPSLHVVATHPRLVHVALRNRRQLLPFRRVISWSRSCYHFFIATVYVFVECTLSFGIRFCLCWFSGSFSSEGLAFGTSSAIQSHSSFEESFWIDNCTSFNMCIASLHNCVPITVPMCSIPVSTNHTSISYPMEGKHVVHLHTKQKPRPCVHYAPFSISSHELLVTIRSAILIVARTQRDSIHDCLANRDTNDSVLCDS